MEPGRINPSQIRWRPGDQFSLSLSIYRFSLLLLVRSPRSRPSDGLSTNPGVGFSEFHGGFRGAILLLSGAAVMCLPCPRLIRVLRTTLDYRYVHVLRHSGGQNAAAPLPLFFFFSFFLPTTVGAESNDLSPPRTRRIWQNSEHNNFIDRSDKRLVATSATSRQPVGAH